VEGWPVASGTIRTFARLRMTAWIKITDGVSHLLVWRFSVMEHYSLERWNTFLLGSFPQAKGYSVGYRLFALPSASEFLEWGERRVNQELESLREAMGRITNKEVRVFVKDAEELRREKYAAQQAAKQSKEQPAAKEKKAGKDEKKPEGAAVPADKGATAAKKGNTKKQSEEGDKKDEHVTISHIDLRVGVVLSAENHPGGDTLYVEKIDVGEKEPRTIVSGIREHVPLDQFVGSRVVVMCNLKEKPLRGVNSNGMICCASIQEGEKRTVRLLDISDTAKPGDRVAWHGEEAGVVADPTPISANKLTKLLKGLRTDVEGHVVFGEQGFKANTNGHPITCKALPNGVVG